MSSGISLILFNEGTTDRLIDLLFSSYKIIHFLSFQIMGIYSCTFTSIATYDTFNYNSPLMKYYVVRPDT